MTVLVDTDALLGLFNPEDIHVERADKVAAKLGDEGAEFFILPTTMGEFALLASSKIGVEMTKKALREMKEMSYGVIDVTAELAVEAMGLYEKQKSKEESLFDCFVMAAARKHEVDFIFSFDRGYVKNGFKLAGEI